MPECRQRQRVQVPPERDGFLAAVEDDAADETLTGRLSQDFEPLEVTCVDGRGRFGFNAHDFAGAVFQYQVNFLAVACPEVEQVRLKLRPTALLEKFQCDKVL